MEQKGFDYDLKHYLHSNPLCFNKGTNDEQHSFFGI